MGGEEDPAGNGRLRLLAPPIQRLLFRLDGWSQLSKVPEKRQHLQFLSEAGLIPRSGLGIDKLSNFSLAGEISPLANDEPLPLRPCLRTPSPTLSLTRSLFFFACAIGDSSLSDNLPGDKTLSGLTLKLWVPLVAPFDRREPFTVL
nr:hypothetical protein Iba_chr11fCG10470 [Ipomoea batatas]